MRKWLLKQASGDVLEISVGTGRNFKARRLRGKYEHDYVTAVAAQRGVTRCSPGQRAHPRACLQPVLLLLLLLVLPSSHLPYLARSTTTCPSPAAFARSRAQTCRSTCCSGPRTRWARGHRTRGMGGGGLAPCARVRM